VTGDRRPRELTPRLARSYENFGFKGATSRGDHWIEPDGFGASRFSRTVWWGHMVVSGRNRFFYRVLPVVVNTVRMRQIAGEFQIRFARIG